jgi:hypothetical protein
MYVFAHRANYRSKLRGIQPLEINEKNKYSINSDSAPVKFITRSWNNLVFDKKNNKEFNQKASLHDTFFKASKKSVEIQSNKR